MQEREDKRWKELLWRQPRTPSEQDELRRLVAAHPAAEGQWRAEASLNRALEQLPSAPVSSNFTARVVAEARRRAAASSRRRREAPWFLRGWLPRLTAGVLMASVGFISFREYRESVQARQARELAEASRLATLPPMDWLHDFDTIQRLNNVKAADEDLLAALE